MKVIIVNPINYGRGPTSLRPPFGLLCIAAVLMKHNVELIWIDADVIRDQAEVMRQIQRHADADLLATGGMHTTYPYIQLLFQNLLEVKSTIPTIVGGRVASSIKHILWEYVAGMDMLCEQDGEPVVEALIEHLPNWQNAPGIQYRKEGKIIINPPAPVAKKLDGMPNLPWHFLPDGYFPRKVGFLLTGRGCPFKCHFCRTDEDPVEKYRTIDLDTVMEDVRYMVEERGVKRLVLVDEFFLQKKSRALEFSKRVKPYGIEWRCTARADTLTEKDLPLLKELKESGCHAISVGLETGSPEMLVRMNKKMNPERAERSIKLIREAGLGLTPTFIFAYPGENRQTALESIRWRKKVGLLGGYFYATPYPGSGLYNDWVKENGFSLAEEEALLRQSMGVKDFNINMTDMPNWQLKLLSAECLFRLNPWIYNYNHYIKREVKQWMDNVGQWFRGGSTAPKAELEAPKPPHF
ncbi:MAG: radical SAM protein [Magnetococcales bacterium]|nr:radical SAM protein [Magnetococcales bacterium]